MATYTSLPRLLAIAKSDSPTISTGIRGDETWTRAQFKAWFLKCLNDKINRNDPRTTWRKLQWEYQAALRHDAVIIADYGKRIIHPGRNVLSTKELQVRFPHVNTNMLGE